MKRDVPLYWGERDDPRRREVGLAVIDTETGEIDAVVTDRDARFWINSEIDHMCVSFSFGMKRPHVTTTEEVSEFVTNSSPETRTKIKGILGKLDTLDSQIDALHGPGAAAAIDAAFANGSIFRDKEGT